MKDNPLEKDLFSEFPPATYEDWKKAASAELNGQDPEQMLSWQISDLQGKPYYDASAGTPLVRCLLHPGHTWINTTYVTVADCQTANVHALQHLKDGADGIVFQCTDIHLSSIALESLLHNIEWSWCHLVWVLPQPDDELPNIFSDFINKKNYAPNALKGALYFTSCSHHPQSLHKLVHIFHQQQSLHCLGLLLPNTDFTQSIAEALHEAVQVVHALQELGLTATEVLPRICFAVQIGNDFFLEIARLRAMRWLWFQIVRAYGLNSYAPGSLHIQALSTAWCSETFGPHSNMIKSTTAAMAAVIGGCNALAIVPEHEEDGRMRRIARNVSLLLKEESHFDWVADPLAGSYYVERLTTQMAQKAWARFQSLPSL